jgi:hypothetical protein
VTAKLIKGINETCPIAAAVTEGQNVKYLNK